MLLLIPRQMRLVSFKILVQVVQITEPTKAYKNNRFEENNYFYG